MTAPLFEFAAFGRHGAIYAALAIGIAFGWCLERAGMGSARKLSGQFYLTDLTVFKVMFSAIVTAMLGAFWLGRIGVLDLSRVYVPETFVVPQLVGGLVFGVGFAIGGLCPGTSCVAAATGRADGLLVMLGMFAGVIGTGLAFGSISDFYASTARGSITLPQLLHVPYGVVVCAVVSMALIAFWLTKRFDRIPVGIHVGRGRAFAVAAALCGALAAFAGSPYRANHATVDVERLAAAVAHEEDHVTAVELAEWIRGRKPGLRVIDLRPAVEFETYHVPRAERIALESLGSTPFRATETIVLISGGGAHAAQAWVLLQALGHKQVFFLRGGLQEWIDDVMNPTILASASPRAMAEFKRVGEISRYFGGVPRIVDKLDPRPANSDASGDRSESSTSDAAAAIRRRGC